MAEPKSHAYRLHLLSRRLVTGILGAVIGISPWLPLPALAELKIVPSLTVSEQYDSNVLFTSSGSESDFVTIVTPKLTATYKGRPLDATLSGSVSSAFYADHSDLNNVSAAGSLTVDLTQLVSRLDKRARLQLSDSVYYTPEPAAFVSATESNPFATGQQPQRVRTFTYSSSVTGGYALTPIVDLTAGYIYSFLNFGTSVGAPLQTAVFRTKLQNVNAGPGVKLTSVDTLNLQYLYSKVDFNGGAVPGFHTQGGTIGLTHAFSPQLTGSAAAGATLISPSDRVAPLVNLLVSWNERNTTTTFSFSRAVTPSFLVNATALETSLVALTVTHRLTALLVATGALNYAHSSSVTGISTTGTPGTGPATSDLTFDSYGTNFGLTYSITRWATASFSYGHTYFKQESLNITSSFHRDVVMLSLTASWL